MTATTQEDCPSIHAKNALESIVEMVANLELETAAHYYADRCDTGQAIRLLQEYHHPETIDYSVIAPDRIKSELAELMEDEEIIPPDFDFNEDEARQTIDDDPLEISARGGWHAPGQVAASDDEYRILLTAAPPSESRANLTNTANPSPLKSKGKIGSNPGPPTPEPTLKKTLPLLPTPNNSIGGIDSSTAARPLGPPSRLKPSPTAAADPRNESRTKMNPWCIANNCNNAPSLEFQTRKSPGWAPCCTVHLPVLGRTGGLEIRDINTLEIIPNSEREMHLYRSRLHNTHLSRMNSPIPYRTETI